MTTRSGLPKYCKLREEIRGRIARGELAPGDRLPSERVLAQRSGYSRITVRAALAELVHEGLLRRVQGSGTFVAETPFTGQEAKPAIQVVCPPMQSSSEEGDGFISEVVAALSRIAAGDGRSVTLTTVPRGESLLRLVKSGRLSCDPENGLLIVARAPTDAEVRFLKERDIPFVLIGHPAGSEVIPCVQGDHAAGGAEAVRHLLGHGYHRIALVDGTPGFASAPERDEACRRTLEEAGLRLDPKLVVETIAWDRNAGSRAAKQLLRRGAKFDAVLSGGDWSTFGLLTVFAERGIRIPEDVAVIMFDYFPWVDRAFPIEMTAVREPHEELAQEAMNLLAMAREGRALLECERRVCLQLLIRRSCGCAAPAR